MQFSCWVPYLPKSIYVAIDVANDSGFPFRQIVAAVYLFLNILMKQYFAETVLPANASMAPL